MVVYNSLGRPYTGMVHIPIMKESILVTNPDGIAVPVQVLMSRFIGFLLLFFYRLFLLVM